MTLRNKSLVIIILVSLLIISLINTSARLILLKGFSTLEEVYCQKNLQRASNALTSEKKHLFALAHDYAVWDDSYIFAEDLNPAYVSSNMNPATFASLGINFFIFTDNSGKVIASYGYDLTKNVTIAVSADLLDLISTSELFHKIDSNTDSTGFVISNGKPILLAYHPILTSVSAGPPHGLLIMGRLMGDDFTAQLSDTTQLTIEIEPYQNSALSLELKTVKQVVGSEPAISIKILDPQSIAGYVVFPDIFGNPALILRTVMERDIYNHGYTTILFFINVVFFGSVFFFATALILLDKQVFIRISSLSKSVLGVRLSGQLSDRVEVKGKDEITTLSTEINEMLQSLEVADFNLRHSRDELEKLVEERTATLVQVNEELTYEISERELGQKALLDAYREIHLIISTISSIMIGVDSDRMVTLWNDVAAEMLGLSSIDVTGLDFFSLPINWDWENISKKTAECTKNNQKIRMDDITLVTRENKPRVLGITLTPLFLKNKEQAGFLLIASDITERRLLEQQWGRSNKLEAIGQLTAGVAHEINTPTQLVGSNLRFLGQQLEPVLTLIDKVYQLNRAVKNGTATPELAIELEKAAIATHLEYFRQEAPKAIEQSLEGIDRISRIISAMRFFSHPGSEYKEMADLNQIIENALSLSHNEWKNVAEIITDLEADIPAVECLPIDLSQVVLNLIINAVHAIQDVAGDEPTTKGQIVITSRQIGELVEVRIADSGTGIPPEIHDKIFDPFFTTKDVGRGTGQGLAIAYTVIVQKHGGTIEFETELGRGTTFIIRFPKKADQ